MHFGIVGDMAQQVKALEVVAHDSTLIICQWCGGTGNELYSMYRRCPECGGVGVVDRTEDDPVESLRKRGNEGPDDRP